MILLKTLSILKNTQLVKKFAQDLGFEQCGIAKAEFLEKEAPLLEKWLKNQFHSKMSYLENHFDKRLDPTLLVPGSQSVISLIFNYFPKRDLAKNSSEKDNYKIAKYAYGQDYHFVIKNKLKEFMQLIKDEIGAIEGRVFVDSAPVMERSWAAKSGIGWIGKNSLLLNKQIGSFFFLAELIIDLELEPDTPITDYCGTCTRCIDICPTAAIVAPQVIDANKCISYFTIELKDALPKEYSDKFDNWIFGCDACQDVCPWNRFSKSHQTPEFDPHPDLENMNKKDWKEMTEDVFKKVFKKSAVKRTKYTGLKRNIDFLNNE